MQTYLFLLGRTPELSVLEIQSVVSAEAKVFLPGIVQAELENDDEAVRLFNQLGGSLKVLRIDGEFQDLTTDQLQEYATAYLADHARPTFAIAEIGRDKFPKVDISLIKIALRARGVASRFIDGPRSGLSASVLVHHDKVIELTLIQDGTRTLFARTLSTQDIDDWTKRDRAKPYADRKKGMLPPKVARMMVNLALGQLPGIQQPMIYDPFCGSGTVLLEAAMRGARVLGSDLDTDAVLGTQTNLNWFCVAYEQSQLSAHVFQSDVANIQVDRLPINQKQVDAVVTEPFLGKPTPAVVQLANIFKGLEKMYLGAFKQWTKLLRPGGVVVIIFPVVDAEKKHFSLEGMIDKLRAFGYTPVFEPVLYHRPQAVVQRQIWVFRFGAIAPKTPTAN